MISAPEYDLLCKLLQLHSGLFLGPGRDDLIESRLGPVSSALGLGGVSGLLRDPRALENDETIRAICEAMATHESSFFRDYAPFAALRDCILPDLLAKRRASRRLRIWCAAAAAGQEPYSIAILLNEMPVSLRDWSIDILATDYSRSALARARNGTYNDFEVRRGLSTERLARYFTRVGPDWRISERLRRAVTFSERNLVEHFEDLGRFDLVLCRNVLLYFDGPTRTSVLHRMRGALEDDGYLLLGASETAAGLSTLFERAPDVGTRAYRPRAMDAVGTGPTVASRAPAW